MIPPAYVALAGHADKYGCCTGTQAGNRFFGFLKGLQIQALAGQYDNPIPTRFLAPIDWFKIPALAGRYDNPEPVFVNVYGAQESIPRNRLRQAM